MAVFWCATGLGRGSDLLVLRAVHSTFQGIEAPPFPTPLPLGGLRLRHSPLSSPEGPLQQLEKIHRAPDGALCFFVHRTDRCKLACIRNGRVQKKPSSVA